MEQSPAVDRHFFELYCTVHCSSAFCEVPEHSHVGMQVPHFFWVNWIRAITILRVRSSAITIRLFGNVPLQIHLYPARAILYARIVFGPICRPYCTSRANSTTQNTLASQAEPFESSHTPMIRPTEPSEPVGHATHRNTHPSATNPNPTEAATAAAAARWRTRKTSKEE